jgi:hypothetical protein
MDTRTSLAIGRGAVVGVGLAGLFSEQGVALSLEKGEDQAVVVFPTAFEPVASKPDESPSEADTLAPQFDTSEHVITVWNLRLETESGPQLAQLYRLPLAPPSTFTLTYGQVLALGGDFYGDPTQPVCTSSEPVGQFRKNFEQLAGAPQTEVASLLGIAYLFEFAPISLLAWNWQPSGVYAGMKTTPPHWISDEDRAFDEATGGTFFKNGRYLNLAITNFDHFGVDAITCYKAGHQLAQEEAVRAKSISDPNTRAQALARAYAVNAFADHFLSDLFAAGHMRTPRRRLYESAETEKTREGAGLCAKQMHDEDNKFGLWVENALGDRWVAYGDARYRDTWNAAGRVVVRKALQQSMNDVWTAFQTRQVLNEPTLVLRYLAKVITQIGQVGERDDPHNWAPLFWLDPGSGNVNRRKELFDPSNREYILQGYPKGCWGITTTVLEIVAGGFHVYMPKNVYPKNVPFPPNEQGMTGEYGWPPLPGGMSGPQRGVTGCDLRGFTGWFIDHTPGPTH